MPPPTTRVLHVPNRAFGNPNQPSWSLRPECDTLPTPPVPVCHRTPPHSAPAARAAQHSHARCSAPAYTKIAPGSVFSCVAVDFVPHQQAIHNMRRGSSPLESLSENRCQPPITESFSALAGTRTSLYLATGNLNNIVLAPWLSLLRAAHVKGSPFGVSVTLILRLIIHCRTPA